MSRTECPLEEGDRVDHKLFGFGTIIGAPVAVVGPDMHSSSGVRDAGWRLLIRWDDSTREDSDMGYEMGSPHMRKVSSPDSRPFTYWDRQWQPLLQAWLEARKKVERVSSTFRPLPDRAELERALVAERSAYEAMQRFWESEASGQHP
nr:hypothetical protein BN993_02867 [Virgibacillus halodenitrificans]